MVGGGGIWPALGEGGVCGVASPLSGRASVLGGGFGVAGSGGGGVAYFRGRRAHLGFGAEGLQGRNLVGKGGAGAVVMAAQWTARWRWKR